MVRLIAVHASDQAKVVGLLGNIWKQVRDRFPELRPGLTYRRPVGPKTSAIESNQTIQLYLVTITECTFYSSES